MDSAKLGRAEQSSTLRSTFYQTRVLWDIFFSTRLLNTKLLRNGFRTQKLLAALHKHCVMSKGGLLGSTYQGE
ncbi:hypothetical protein CH63R_05574 [Colletotrichum higginsianum IMI 349063]|uniref:Uncharacterized protein n=1 Tax=Colletotrichum higginsianum (strain IMI 349063) TaxID=759273 RepID=A0A1B7YD04_COLHI|nr:hypothetical protein CH63R_05574 [Colletotrichum higginsianum IMI 349063]OBR09882.1 hypothetical protein CH63R_05574 [Colletotrichum higginsianum IMI 349063]GJD03090.1 hypothetical protein ColKHC_11915 [Colletotrichum higginsianum]